MTDGVDEGEQFGQITFVVEVRVPDEPRRVVVLRGATGRAAVDALLRAAAVDEPDGSDRLTPAERVIVRTVGAGSTNAEAATQLCVSTHTVAAHLRSIYSKLGIGSRIELVRLVSSGRFAT